MIGYVESSLLDVNTSLLAERLVQQAWPLLPASELVVIFSHTRACYFLVPPVRKKTICLFRVVHSMVSRRLYGKRGFVFWEHCVCQPESNDNV